MAKVEASSTLRLACCAIWALMGAAVPTRAANLLTLDNGASVARVTSTYGDSWSALHLLDGQSGTGYSSAENRVSQQQIVFELAARSEIAALQFDQRLVDGPGRGARQIELGIADTDDERAFVSILQAELAESGQLQRFVLAERAAGRYLRLRLLDNHGARDYLELGGFTVEGRALAAVSPLQVSGVYQTANYGAFRIRQQGQSISGCYESAGGTLVGRLTANVLRLRWQEAPHNEGTATLVFSADGQRFSGLWWNAGDEGAAGKPDWYGQRIADVPGGCPHSNAFDPGGLPAERVDQ